MNEKEKWDQAAVDYQRVFALGLCDYNTSLLHFWQEHRMIYPGCRVLDIGCGVGRYGTYLSELGCEVTLTDLSGEMLRCARENMARCQTSWTTYQCDFHEVTGNEPVFANGFDLVISTMSPAICDTETVRKMSFMSRGWCFLARFSDWAQPFRDLLMRELGLEPHLAFSDLKGDCESMIKAVRTAGGSPQTRYVDYNWADTRTPEEMADYMIRHYFTEDGDRERLYSEILHLAKKHAGKDGTVTDAVNTKVLWITWKAQNLRES